MPSLTSSGSVSILISSRNQGKEKTWSSTYPNLHPFIFQMILTQIRKSSWSRSSFRRANVRFSLRTGYGFS
ncbi:hypothetical protein FGO68_gene9623 [Halteria grandinella]|uniref:Uncharacterized protein n=1 Tax=Halteria grandinella TaxID=5974 RepID=A0A8J8P2S1_HALGN|nr:hypothetical protein FGO68_gene9623 [Halteria grandinella]